MHKKTDELNRYLHVRVFEALHMEPADPEIPFKYADACALSSKRILEALKA